MHLYIIQCYNKAGYPIGNYYVVASSERKAKAALKVDQRVSGWVVKMVTENVLTIIITD